MLYTSNNFKISLSVPSVTIDNKSWDKFQGGGRVAETSSHNPGGMEPAVAVSGVTKRNQATLERAWDDVLIGAFIGLDGAVGSPCAVAVTPLRTPTTTAGRQRAYTGVIREVTPPEQDSTSSSISMLQIVIELNEPITG
jgi:hypothetical protein